MHLRIKYLDATAWKVFWRPNKWGPPSETLMETGGELFGYVILHIQFFSLPLNTQIPYRTYLWKATLKIHAWTLDRKHKIQIALL